VPQKLKEVDVVVIGVGFAGSILAKELAASGLKVVGLERGKERHSVPDFQAPAIHDELKYSVRSSKFGFFISTGKITVCGLAFA